MNNLNIDNTQNLSFLLAKELEVIESLVCLNKHTLNILSQYTSVEEYEHKLSQITQGDDVAV